MLKFIGEVERVGESKASGQQPDGQKKEDFLPDESMHRLDSSAKENDMSTLATVSRFGQARQETGPRFAWAWLMGMR